MPLRAIYSAYIFPYRLLWPAGDLWLQFIDKEFEGQKRNITGACEMVEMILWVKALVANPGDQSSIPGVHVLEENLTPSKLPTAVIARTLS